MNLKVKNALISVSNKENLISLLKALKKFNEQSEALQKSVGAISKGLVNTEDAAKRSMSIANAIRTLDISSAFEAINRTRNILDKDGKIIGQELILSPKQQRDALQKLQEDLKGIINISPQLKQAFDEAIANPANITALENLETAAGDASGAAGLLKAEIDDVGAKLADTLGKGDFTKALSNLESLQSLSETSRDGFLALEDGAAGAADEHGQGPGAVDELGDRFLPARHRRVQGLLPRDGDRGRPAHRRDARRLRRSPRRARPRRRRTESRVPRAGPAAGAHESGRGHRRS